MRKIKIEENLIVNCFNPQDFPWEVQLLNLKNSETCMKRTRKDGCIYYYNEFLTFDIETTSVIKENKDEKSFAFMYIGMFDICGEVVFIRTWEEFIDILKKIKSVLYKPCTKLVIYCHFLPFEFQFFRNFVEINEIFATENRKILKATVNDFFEFRCSYRLSNMSLDEFIKNTPGAKFYKKSGDKFDYQKFRDPTTELTDEEMSYCYCDVAGLREAIVQLLNEDNLATIPMTSTGYVRREAKDLIRSSKRNRSLLKNIGLNQELYILSKAARRGGNAHCNPMYSNDILERVKSKDMSSAYPAVMLQRKYPMSRFLPEEKTVDNINNIIAQGSRCLLMDITFYNLKLKDISTIPYIPIAKTNRPKEYRVDNGRILYGSNVTMSLTDIDYSIIEQQYTFDDIEINELYSALYNYLPNEFRKFIFDMYISKCDLKGGNKYIYDKYKNKINANFGMMLTDIVHDDIIYEPTEDDLTPFKILQYDIQESLDKYYKSSSCFLAYQWGLWVTAHCRDRLQKAINGLGPDIVYCDTDSTKYFADIESHEDLFEKLNKEILHETEVCGFNTNYTRKDGKKFALGLWEDDGEYTKFKSLGSKKYGYYENGDKKLHITVAGLSKDKGSKWLEDNGGLDAMKPGTIVPAYKSGRTSAIFNDVIYPSYITIYNPETKKKVQLLNGSSIAVKNVPYTFGLSKDYETLLQDIADNKPIY